MLRGPLTTTAAGRRHLGPTGEPTVISWVQIAFAQPRSCRLVDPARFLKGTQATTLLRAVNVVRFLD